jgi:hypothetical protein
MSKAYFTEKLAKIQLAQIEIDKILAEIEGKSPIGTNSKINNKRSGLTIDTGAKLDNADSTKFLAKQYIDQIAKKKGTSPIGKKSIGLRIDTGTPYINPSLLTRKYTRNYEDFLPEEYIEILNKLSERPKTMEITKKELPKKFQGMSMISRRNINDIENIDNENLIKGYASKVTSDDELTIKAYRIPHERNQEIKKK